MRYLSGLCLLLVLACSNGDNKGIPSGFREPTKEELRSAMRYHGILFAEQDDRGEWYFCREGKRCRLFAYLETRKK